MNFCSSVERTFGDECYISTKRVTYAYHALNAQGIFESFRSTWAILLFGPDEKCIRSNDNKMQAWFKTSAAIRNAC
jgi:hypothetical protein